MTREEAIKIIEVVFKSKEAYKHNDSVTHQALNMAIEALQADWISINESEPNTSDHVLVTYRWGDDDYEVSELDYWVTKYAAENGNAQCKRLIEHVIAWRYMLAPYKGGDAE